MTKQCDNNVQQCKCMAVEASEEALMGELWLWGKLKWKGKLGWNNPVIILLLMNPAVTCWADIVSKYIAVLEKDLK